LLLSFTVGSEHADRIEIPVRRQYGRDQGERSAVQQGLRQKHVPLLKRCRRRACPRTEPAAFNIGGERKVLDDASQTNYVAIWIGPAGAVDKEWAEAGERAAGRRVRPSSTAGIVQGDLIVQIGFNLPNSGPLSTSVP
jgi:hypothetical protein